MTENQIEPPVDPFAKWKIDALIERAKREFLIWNLIGVLVPCLWGYAVSDCFHAILSGTFILPGSTFRLTAKGVFATSFGALAGVICILWCFVNLLRWLSWNFGVMHPIDKELSRFGHPEQVAEVIDSQISKAHHFCGGNLIVTPDWMMSYDILSGLKCLRLEDLIWAYSTSWKDEKGRVNSSCAIYESNRRTDIRVTSNKEAERLLAALNQRNPELNLEYDAELAKLFCTDRAAAVEAISRKQHAV